MKNYVECLNYQEVKNFVNFCGFELAEKPRFYKDRITISIINRDLALPLNYALMDYEVQARKGGSKENTLDYLDSLNDKWRFYLFDLFPSYEADLEKEKNITIL